MANRTCAEIIGYGLQAAKIGDDTGISGLDASDNGPLVRVVDRENRALVESPWDNNQPGFDWMIDEVGFTLVSPTDLNGATASGAATVIVDDGTNFDAASGAFAVYTQNQPDVGLYATKSSNTFSTVTRLGAAHLDEDQVYRLYALPSAFGRPRREKGKGDGMTIDTVNFYYLGGGAEPRARQFSVFLDAATGNNFLWVPRDALGYAFVRYDKAATSLTLATQTVDIPVSYDEYLVQKVAKHVLTILGKDPLRIAAAEAEAYVWKKKAFDRRGISKMVSLTRGPIRSDSPLDGMGGAFMAPDGNIYGP